METINALRRISRKFLTNRVRWLLSLSAVVTIALSSSCDGDAELKTLTCGANIADRIYFRLRRRFCSL